MWYLSDRKKEYTVSVEELEKLFYENQEDVAYIKKITSKHKNPNCRPMNMLQTWLGFMEDSYVDGYMIRYPHGNVIGQGERRNFYRGEAEIYPTSKTTLWREISQCKNENQRIVVRLVAAMRVLEFKHFLERTKYVKWWEEHLGAPFYDAIAQHYGFMTQYLDITNDFNVAMFFACCVWENTENKWRPMTEKECREKEKGVLYHAPAENIRFYYDADAVPKIIPIGYQPFMRCQKQIGYVIKMDSMEDFKEDPMFERLHPVTISRQMINRLNLKTEKSMPERDNGMEITTRWCYTGPTAEERYFNICMAEFLKKRDRINLLKGY